MGLSTRLDLADLANISIIFLGHFHQVSGPFLWGIYMSQLLLLGKFEYGGGPIFRVVLEC